MGIGAIHARQAPAVRVLKVVKWDEAPTRCDAVGVRATGWVWQVQPISRRSDDVGCRTNHLVRPPGGARVPGQYRCECRAGAPGRRVGLSPIPEGSVAAGPQSAGQGAKAWPEAEQVPPWEWRHAARDQRQDAQAGEGEPPAAVPPKRPTSFSQFGESEGASAAGSFSCTPLKACRQMASCAEAKYQLQHCGNGRIDGDHDGVPCEAICR